MSDPKDVDKPQRLTQELRGSVSGTVHVGVVQHWYGPFLNYVWVRTLCGLEGRMHGDRHDEPVTCKSCLRKDATDE